MQKKTKLKRDTVLVSGVTVFVGREETKAFFEGQRIEHPDHLYRLR